MTSGINKSVSTDLGVRESRVKKADLSHREAMIHSIAVGALALVAITAAFATLPIGPAITLAVAFALLAGVVINSILSRRKKEEEAGSVEMVVMNIKNDDHLDQKVQVDGKTYRIEKAGTVGLEITPERK
jgi:Flp pilus assembly protein TadB